jgi:predicted RNA binding protein YcfA (HicA-like mRNA interferase family)
MHSRAVIERLEADGSHFHNCHPDKPGRVTVPHPKKDLPIGTLRAIYRQVGWHWGS